MCSYFNHVQQRFIRQTLCNVLLLKMIERQTKLNTNSFNLRCLTNLELKCCRRVAAVILLVELCNDDWRTLVPQLFESEQIYKFVFSHYIQARKQEIKWGGVFCKKWKIGVFCTKVENGGVCKKVDLSSTQGALCTVSVFFILHFTYLGRGCVRT